MAAQVPNIFVEQYDQGQKKIRADLMDENFAYVCSQIDATEGNAEAAQAAADSKTTPSGALSAAMPSGSYVTLSAPTSGTRVTAPGDGYILFGATPPSTASSPSIGLISEVCSRILCRNNIINYVFIPVKGGDNVNVVYLEVGDLVLRYYYGKGNMPQ